MGYLRGALGGESCGPLGSGKTVLGGVGLILKLEVLFEPERGPEVQFKGTRWKNLLLGLTEWLRGSPCWTGGHDSLQAENKLNAPGPILGRFGPDTSIRTLNASGPPFGQNRPVEPSLSRWPRGTCSWSLLPSAGTAAKLSLRSSSHDSGSGSGLGLGLLSASCEAPLSWLPSCAGPGPVQLGPGTTC